VWESFDISPSKIFDFQNILGSKKRVKTPLKIKITITAQQPCIYQGNKYIRSSELSLILPYMTVKFKVSKLPCHTWAVE